MKLLFLRGYSVAPFPRDLPACDDVWVQLVSALGPERAEIWYQTRKRSPSAVALTKNIVLRVVPDLNAKLSFQPDVVMARGGLPWMQAAAGKFKKSFSVYYGASRIRSVPAAGRGWNLVMTDDRKRQQAAAARGYAAELFIKPAAENVFRPHLADKRYAVIFVGNWQSNVDKGHSFFFKHVQERALHVGANRSQWAAKYPNWTFAGRVPRSSLPGLYAQAKVAVIHCPSRDACPRVLPEALACNCPVLVTEQTCFWQERYISAETGCLTTPQNFAADLQTMLAQWHTFSPRAYYDRNLSLDVAAKHLLACIQQHGG